MRTSKKLLKESALVLFPVLIFLSCPVEMALLRYTFFSLINHHFITQFLYFIFYLKKKTLLFLFFISLDLQMDNGYEIFLMVSETCFSLEALTFLSRQEEEMVEKAEQRYLSSISQITTTACLLFLRGLQPLALTPLDLLLC